MSLGALGVLAVLSVRTATPTIEAPGSVILTVHLPNLPESRLGSDM